MTAVEFYSMETIMKKMLVVSLLATVLPITSFASNEQLVSVFETYCHQQKDNSRTFDRDATNETDKEVSKFELARGQGDNAYMMTVLGRPYLIEWIGDACRVSTNGALPNDVMRALATNHVLTVPHGDNVAFSPVLWFEPNHALTRYVFTHDLSSSTIVFEYQKDNSTSYGPVAITVTK